jgi:tetratricopeptide (TPR) repeat protein
MRLQCYLPVLVALGGLFLIPSSRAQSVLNSYVAPDIEIAVETADSKPVPEQTIVQLIGFNGRLYDQKSLRNGKTRFDQVSKSEFRVLVMAPGYQRAEKRVDVTTGVLLATVSIEFQPMGDAEDVASDVGLNSLNPKTQREVGKALEALRKKKPIDARKHLEAAQRQVPNNAEVEYLFGIYAMQVRDVAEAQAHWTRTLKFNPNHLSALLEVAQGFLAEKKSAEAMPYLNRALAVEPSSWRAHALLAEADYLEGNRDEAMKHAERALDLGHERAASLEPLLAAELAESGDAKRAISILENYVKANPSDTDAVKQLERLRNPESPVADGGAPGTLGTTSFSTMNAKVLELPIRPNWLPPDVDDRIPAVEPEAVCSLDEILPKVADQLVALIRNVDHFTATETVADETINKWGVVSSSEKRKFDYLVSIEQIPSGHLIVDEYRSGGGKPAEFPDGFITNGLPALVMVFHPSYVGTYEMSCEGLARRNEGLAWQVHFRQRSDKPAAIRGFQVGMRGSSHPAALKGRAWISAESYQIVRLETDLVRPMPGIRLLAEHTAIEYGSVNFREGNVKLWLPVSAEVHFEWMGQRIHRRHSFDNYMLFWIEERERIGSPKNVDTVNSPGRNTKDSRP